MSKDLSLSVDSFKKLLTSRSLDELRKTVKQEDSRYLNLFHQVLGENEWCFKHPKLVLKTACLFSKAEEMLPVEKKVVSLAVKSGILKNSQEKEEVKAILLDALYNNNSWLSLELIRGGADVNVRNNDDGCTPLHYAAAAGHAHLVEELIENRASVSARDNTDNTPLHFAAANDHPYIVKKLIENEASVNARNGVGNAPLHIAAFYGYIRVAEKLVSSKASVNARNDADNTPLHFAASEGHAGISKLLIKNKANINTETEIGQTPLLTALNKGHAEVSRLLIEMGAITINEINFKFASGIPKIRKNLSDLLNEKDWREKCPVGAFKVDCLLSPSIEAMSAKAEETIMNLKALKYPKHAKEEDFEYLTQMLRVGAAVAKLSGKSTRNVNTYDLIIKRDNITIKYKSPQ